MNLNKTLSKNLIVLTGLLLMSISLSRAQKLTITGVYDGPLSGGKPKGIELYAMAKINNLSQYGISKVSNGNGTAGSANYTFPDDTIPAGTYIFVTTDSAGFHSFFGFKAHYIYGGLTVNGDDAVELYHNNSLISVFGDVDTDGTGEPWEYKDGWAYLKNTKAADTSFNVNDWKYSGVDELEGGQKNMETNMPFKAGHYFPASAKFKMKAKHSYSVPGKVFDKSAAEIPAWEKGIDSIYFTDGNSNAIRILKMDKTGFTFSDSIDLKPYGDGVNSIDLKNGILAVAVERTDAQDDSKQLKGKVIFFDKAGNLLDSVTAGYLPDMVTFTPNGDSVLVANEGEPNETYSHDPEGSISIIDLTPGLGNLGTPTEVTFDNLDSATLVNKGVRIFGPGSSVAQDLEPEYISISPGGDSAFVTLQENNAVLAIDLSNPVVNNDNVHALGYKDHSLMKNALDASDEEGKINIKSWPLLGMYQPDAIASYTVNGKIYYLTANEGDAREYDALDEETSVEDVALDQDNFPDFNDLQKEENLGDIDITNTMGDNDGDGKYDSLFSFGARSFSIRKGMSGELVFDSKNDFEKITSEKYPFFFNADNDEQDFDGRSDAKGPEPEGLVTGTMKGRTYVFIGLERIGGIMVYDVTDPLNPKFETYVNNRDFNAPVKEAGDLGPEGMVFIPPMTPNDYGKLIVTNEVSGTVTSYSFKPGMPAMKMQVPEETSFKLTLLHNNDAESHIVSDGNFGGAATFKSVADSVRKKAEMEGHEVLMLSSGDNYLAGKQFDASLNRDHSKKYYDAIVIDSLNYDALCLGNHDFDFGPGVLSKFISDVDGSKPPFLSSNLDFSSSDTLNKFMGSRIKKSHIVEKGGEKIGIIGATTPELASISSPGPVTVGQAVADSIMKQVNKMKNNGINKIIVISHLQSINNDTAMIKNLDNVDIVIAGGGDDLLAKPDSRLIPGDSREGPYPIIKQDVNGDSVPIVTTSGGYEYLGRLITYFDNAGNLLGIGEKSGPIAIFKGNTVPNPALEAVKDSINNYTKGIDNNNIAKTGVKLNGERKDIRTKETNFGNLIADALLWQANEKAEERNVDSADIAIQNAGGIRNSVVIPAGDSISEGDTYDALPFGNDVVIMNNINTSTLLDVMENAVSKVENVDGRFAQIAGFKVVYHKDSTAMQIDENGNTTQEGNRIKTIELSNGEQIVDNYKIKTDTTLRVATNDFIAEGGDQYPWTNASYDKMIVPYQKALFNYLTQEMGLDSMVTADDYPEGGENRIRQPQVVTSKKALKESYKEKSGCIIYPNPSSEKAAIQCKKKINRVMLYNVDGRAILTGSADNKKFNIDVSAYNSGIYHLIITNEKDKTRSFRLMVK